MAIAGPNCLGHINLCRRHSADLQRLRAGAAGGAAKHRVLSQSGAMATVLRAALHARDIALSFSISTGNEAVDTIEAFSTI